MVTAYNRANCHEYRENDVVMTTLKTAEMRDVVLSCHVGGAAGGRTISCSARRGSSGELAERGEGVKVSF